MSDNQLVPASTATPKSIAVNPEAPAQVTDAEADAAAKSLGMVTFSSSKSRQLKTIGVYQSQLGVIHLGVGRLAACEDALQKLMEAAVAVATDGEEDTEKRVGAMMAGKGLAEALQKGIQMAAEFQTDKLIGGPTNPRKRSFETDQPIVPINAQTVNINVDSKAAPVESKP